ncbi:type III secretion system gatekeeper subunit SctW [Castellaniella sp.]|uniref:type III secretion system gatekeeper subunit SctW n=1 Tax=Castellaniella sp. TaxID=1955812 RepID=UPI002AFFBC78|nr:type III secretion system gatekeeper subunit SctW [Castellaniella sp.]
MNRIDAGGITPGFSSPGQQPGFSTDQPRTGTLMGEHAVLLKGGIDSLNDAAEEISLHMAEKTENKHHAERKVKPERPVELMQPAEIIEMLQQGQDPNAQAKLEALVEKLLSGQGSPRQEAAQAFDDVSQQFLALQYTLRKGEQDGASPELLETLRDALADLEIDSGPQIRAGLNALGSAAEFASDAQGVQTFQSTYRDIVLGENTLGKTLGLALERFGGKDMARGLTQLVAALGQDLSSTRPSTDPRRLQALTSDLYHLQVAATVLEGCTDLSGNLQSKGLGAPDSERLMRDLVSLTSEKWLSESRFTSLTQQHGVTTPEGRIMLLTGIKSLLRDLPVPVFPDSDTRQGILSAAQDALDLAIDEEDL